MKKLNLTTVLITIIAHTFSQSVKPPSILPGGADKWVLEWQDEFNYPNSQLDAEWDAENGPCQHLLCSRWRENAVVTDGKLRLVNKKENRGGQGWTSANIWTKKQFQYGYFECRYKYAAAHATNNSFWLMTRGNSPTSGKRFEIDINEGHYPNEINTNIHNWSDFFMEGNVKSHHSYSKSYPFGNRPDHSIQLEIPITTQKIRLTSNSGGHFHIGELRVFGVNEQGYPNALSETADNDVKGLVNLMLDNAIKVTASGSYKGDVRFKAGNIADGKPSTHWVTQEEGEKWVEISFPSPKRIGCVQIVNGYEENGNWRGLMTDYTLQYLDGNVWNDIATFDINNGIYNFANDFHCFGLDWGKDELVFYFDGKEIRREKNVFCHSPSPIWLSEAIIGWSGKIDEKQLDGSAMVVDYVRVFKRR